MGDNRINGCGACSGIFRWIKPPHYRFFERECVLHDVRYNIGGTEEDRMKADVLLFEDMVQHSIDYFGARRMLKSQVWFIWWALAYYWAVRAFGRGSFRYTL